MARRGLALLLGLILVGCTRLVDARPQAELPVAPIAAGQVGDLLSVDAKRGGDGNLFTTVEPDECAGVAREVGPPFIFDAKPAAHDGGHWEAGVSVEEMIGVYHASFDAKAAVDRVTHAIDSCRDRQLTVTAMAGQVLAIRLMPPVNSGSSQIVLWSFASSGWACDNAFVAAHNAAIEITTCSTVNGYDVGSLARQALKRIEALVNTVA